LKTKQVDHVIVYSVVKVLWIVEADRISPLESHVTVCPMQYIAWDRI